MIDQVLRFLRFWPLFEVRWSPYDRHPHVWADAHGDHILCHLLAASHASVIALSNDIGQPIVDDDFDIDVGILRQELRKLRQQDRVGGMLGGCDPNRAGWLLPKFPYSRKLGLDLLEPRAHGVKQAFACLRRRDASRGARQEPKPEPSADGV